MPDNSAGLHERDDLLSASTKDRHRAIASLMEELEAVDWYQQRVDATEDESLAAILAHNRDEEKEHAAMVIEWLRRHDARFAEQLATYLNTEGPITAVEESAAEAGPAGEGHGAGASAADGSLGIGSLKEEGTL